MKMVHRPFNREKIDSYMGLGLAYFQTNHDKPISENEVREPMAWDSSPGTRTPQ